MSDERIALAQALNAAGKIDDKAMQNLMERIHEEKMKIAAEASKQLDMHAEDAFRYGGIVGAAQARGRGRREPSWEDKLCMRMGWHDVKDMPNTIRLSIINSGNSIFLTVVTVHNDEAVIIRDDPNMFPSDLVVTQLRMLCSA